MNFNMHVRSLVEILSQEQTVCYDINSNLSITNRAIPLQYAIWLAIISVGKRNTYSISS